MKKTLKLFGSLILTLALVFAMALTSGAEEADAIANVVVSPITLHISNVADGDTITAYKLFGYKGENSYNDYEVDTGFENYVKALLQSTSTDGTVAEKYLESFANDLQGLASLLGNYAAVFNTTDSYKLHTTPKTATASSTVAELKDLTPGYYMILGSTTTEKVYNPMSVFIQVKGDKVIVNGSEISGNTYEMEAKSQTGPEIDKKVYDNRASETGWKTAAAGKVGDELDFYVSMVIPNYTGVSDMTLRLKDTLTNLEYVADTAKVYASRDGSEEITGALDGTETGTDEAGNQTVIFSLSYEAVKGKTVYIKYKAAIKKEAAANNASNKAQLTYGTSSTEEKTTNIYTYALDVKKTKIDGETKLDGAKFTIYTDDAMKNALEFVKENDYYRPATAQDSENNKVTELDAEFLIKGLNLGVYYMKETVIPTGYYAPKNGFTVVLTGERDTATLTLTGNLTNGTAVTAMDNRDSVLIGKNEFSNNQYNVTIKNSATPILPSTGGAGTVLFTIVGVALMVLAVWLFFFRGKKTAK